MALLDFLSNLGGLGEGYLRGQNQLQQLQSQQYVNALRALAMQQYMQKQQAAPGAWQTLSSPAFQNMFGLGGGLPSGMSSSQPGQIQTDTLPPAAPNMANLPQVPNATAQLGGAALSGLFDPTSAPFPTQQNAVRDAAATPLSFTDAGGTLTPSPAPWGGGVTPQQAISQTAAAPDPSLVARRDIASALSPETQPLSSAGASNTFRALGGSPLQYVNRFDDPGKLAQVISQANPGADDITKMAIFEKLFPLLSSTGKASFTQAWDIFKFGEQQTEKKEEFKQREADRAAQLEQARILSGMRLDQSAQAGGQVYQPRDDQGQPIGSPVWIAKGVASPIAGMPQGAAGVTKTGTQAAGGPSSAAEIEWLARYVKATGTMPVGFSRNRQTLDQVYAKVAELGGDPGQVAEAAGTFKANQTSLASATKLRDAALSYEKTALRNLDVATAQLNKVAPTNWGPTVNKWIETGQTFTGDPNVPASVAAVVTVANEYAKVMSGATGAQAATVDSRREALEVLSPYFSSGQWDEVSKIVRRDMANRASSLTDQVDIIKSRIAAGGATPMEQAEPKAPSPTGAPDFKTMTNEQILDYLKQPQQ